MRVLLGMSGGLDSTYAARRLIDAGYEVEGAVLIMHDHTEINEAVESADSLGIPLHKIDCRAAFEASVVENFVSEYLAGRTPNPCIVCNSDVKFKCLLDFAEENGFDRIATGHYAKIVSHERGGAVKYALARSKDPKKDQTYMLWRLSQKILSKTLFPLSDMEKGEVREEARTLNLLAADRGESQEICFVPSGDYAEFIEQRRGKTPKGSFINNEGKILGEHNGIIRYTVGQRKGLGIAYGSRIFVTDINATDNTITLSTEDVRSDRVELRGISFLSEEEPKAGESMRLYVKVRYLAPPVLCTLTYCGEGVGVALLDTPVRALTPGQSAVFYLDDEVVAGGFIAK